MLNGSNADPHIAVPPVGAENGVLLAYLMMDVDDAARHDLACSVLGRLWPQGATSWRDVAMKNPESPVSAREWALVAIGDFLANI
ncbi:MAG: hypothetical protein QE509_01365 [Gammaproteobacteria bacterium]|jgi:hypothetical protein|nr:hypothetical protein [Gammaproteobacteria bacterium]